jgi:hypothetical protein
VALRVEGRNAIDFGCGNGRFMAMALAMGAYGVSGIEHPENVAQQLIFCAVLEEMLLDLAGFQLTGLNAEWIPLDIDKVHCPGSLFLISYIQTIQIHPIHNPWSTFSAGESHARYSGRFSELRLRLLGGNATRHPACHSAALCALPKCRHAGCLSMQKLESP